ncbi:cytosol aminopeptidase [Drosophila persimilis]|uniref:cytosol aminopeptidase n=1 Tax=Drosophila persimilis TaxID=7234 RepID=UPI000F0765D6|nr:cytosol aminopeptidase [Drosophila persimilis]
MSRLPLFAGLGRSTLGVLRLRGAVPWSLRYQQVRFKCEDMRGVVVGLYEQDSGKPKLTEGGDEFDRLGHGMLADLVRESGLKGELGKGRLYHNVGKEYNCLALVGLGREGAGYNHEEVIDEGMENVRVCTAVGARALQLQGCSEVHVDAMGYAEQAAEGAALAVWRYNNNRRKRNRTHIPKLELYQSSDTEGWTRGLFKAESQNLARRLCDTPANQMTPSIFAQATVDALCPCGVTVEVRSINWIEEKNLGSFLTIAKGSCEPPLLLEISYCGTAPEDKPVLLVGKGLTFHSGGLCLKPKTGMDEYRGGVSGAALVVATMRAASALSLPINLSAVLPLCENLPSGMAVRPGDVVTLLNGRTMRVMDPDVAGTVMLADPLLYGQAAFKPRLVVDAGAVARGVTSGLGGSATGVWTNNSFLWKQFQKAGGYTGDRLWRLPLWQYFKDLVTKFGTVDMCNKGRGPASSCLAAAVLHEMVPCSDWVHLDTHGTGMLAKDGVPPYLLKNRMSGRPTRTLIQFLYQLACDCPSA